MLTPKEVFYSDHDTAHTVAIARSKLFQLPMHLVQSDDIYIVRPQADLANIVLWDGELLLDTFVNGKSN